MQDTAIGPRSRSAQTFIDGRCPSNDLTAARDSSGNDALWGHRKTIEQFDDLLGATDHPGTDPNQREYGSDIPS